MFYVGGNRSTSNTRQFTVEQSFINRGYVLVMEVLSDGGGRDGGCGKKERCNSRRSGWVV